MPMYSLIEQSDNYSKISRSLYQFCGDDPKLNVITESESFRFKSKFLDKPNNEGFINAKTAVSLKYLSNFLENSSNTLINCEINLILNWSTNCVISQGNRATTFAITDTKHYIPAVTLSTQDNTKLLQ